MNGLHYANDNVVILFETINVQFIILTEVGEC